MPLGAEFFKPSSFLRNVKNLGQGNSQNICNASFGGHYFPTVLLNVLVSWHKHGKSRNLSWKFMYQGFRCPNMQTSIPWWRPKARGITTSLQVLPVNLPCAICSVVSKMDFEPVHEWNAFFFLFSCYLIVRRRLRVLDVMHSPGQCLSYPLLRSYPGKGHSMLPCF